MKVKQLVELLSGFDLDSTVQVVFPTPTSPRDGVRYRVDL